MDTSSIYYCNICDKTHNSSYYVGGLFSLKHYKCNKCKEFNSKEHHWCDHCGKCNLEKHRWCKHCNKCYTSNNHYWCKYCNICDDLKNHYHCEHCNKCETKLHYRCDHCNNCDSKKHYWCKNCEKCNMEMHYECENCNKCDLKKHYQCEHCEKCIVGGKNFERHRIFNFCCSKPLFHTIFIIPQVIDTLYIPLSIAGNAIFLFSTPWWYTEVPFSVGPINTTDYFVDKARSFNK